MKPKTKLQKRVYELHKNLPDLTQHQKEWALEHCFKHLCIFHKTTKEYICVDCGHRWKYDDLSGNCPHCNSVLTFHDKPRQRVFKDWNYYSIIQTYQEFTVIRIFYIGRYIKLGEVHNLGDFYEISQYWFDDNGGQVILAKNKLMFSFYSNTPFNLRSELNVKQAYKEYDYISPYQVYPKVQVSKTLKRNGLKKSFRGFCEVDVIRYLLSEPIYETLWKQKDLPMIKRFHSDGHRIKKYWKQILKFKNGTTRSRISAYGLITLTFFHILPRTSITLIIYFRQTFPKLMTDWSRRNEPYRNVNGRRPVKNAN